ncbi:zona pellucida sperm-binding protein 3-like [Poecilia reticulata]|uniref:zona pellucida sperm-binding protein 3-like n=1 Tax=Poecilia reticulata TaxID=8081 RepID=UPI0004A317FC|nr:PREDICTED: zona pellucida sperm-binding protein 3-like [Poecilia reticulata]
MEMPLRRRVICLFLFAVWVQLNVLLCVLLQAMTTMGFAVLSVVLLLIISLVFRVSDAIRPLKEGPMIDAEGREYKTVSLEDSSRPTHDGKTTVQVECTEVSMIIFIQADFYNNGRLVSPQELFLGDAKYWKNKPCQAVDAGDGEYVIEADLQDCGSKLMVIGNNLIYSNNLIHSPVVGSLGITRATGAVVPVSCHYKRVHTVSSTVQQHPPSVSISSEFPMGSAPFSLRLKTDDWSAEKYSNTVYLGDPLHLEVSYSGLDQRKLFIDLCVATLTADSTSVPRYCFIENHGCFVDARDGGLNSVFKPRSTTSSLQFQFDAFLFQDDLRNTIYVTCEVKATRQLWRSSPTNKVCNYINSSWKNVDGLDGVCQCCKGVCSKLTSKDDICDTLTLGPFIVIPRK